MSKKVEQTPPRESQSSSVAIKKSVYESLRDKVANANDAMDKGRTRKSELIADAVENQHLHKTAFAWVMKLRKMDPVKRNELLFHFDTMVGYENFTREDLLPDRAAPDSDDADDEDGRDLRPRHLRQPGASAADAVKDLAAKAGAKTSAEDPITKVGRGKAGLN